MTNKLTNLLPSSRQDLIAHEYFFRLGVVAIALFVALVLAAAALLVPTYVFLLGNAQAKETRLATIKTTLSSADEKDLSVRLSSLSNDVATLTMFAKKMPVSVATRSILGITRPGITLSGLLYTSVVGGNSPTLALSGTASSRDALRNYQIALQGAPLVFSAELPVSAYAKDTNITFTITVTLTP